MKRVWVKEKSISFISKLFLMEESTINIDKLISDCIQLLLVCVFFSLFIIHIFASHSKQQNKTKKKLANISENRQNKTTK